MELLAKDSLDSRKDDPTDTFSHSFSTALTKESHGNKLEDGPPASKSLPQLVFPLKDEPQTSRPKGFSEILIDFKEKYPKEPKGQVEKGYSIRSKTSWQGVLKVLDHAATAYAKGAGARGALTKAKEIIQDKADVVERVSKLVPDVDYAKPVVGTLTFLLDVRPPVYELSEAVDELTGQAFQQTSKVRTDVKESIERLQKHFDDVEAYIEMYPDKKKVVEASTSLYITILKAIEDVIGYYTRHMAKAEKAIKALWNGKYYEKSLLESLENISRDGRELIDEANIAHKQVTNKMAGDAEAVLRKTEQIELSIENIKAGANFFIRSLFGDHIKEKEAEAARREQSLRREIERRDDERAMWQQLYFRAVTPEPLPAPESIVSQENILDFLDLKDLEKTDIEYILNQNELMFAGGHSRTEQIMKSAQFRSWLVHAESKELLIHGNSSPGRISPISFFASMLLKNLRDVEQFKSVAFFCGMHSYEDYGGARTLVMSLLTQLLQQQRFDLSFVDRRLASSLDAGNIDDFCYLFRELLRQVKDTETVFCVIDGINFYECYGEDLLQQTAYVLRFLLDLTTRRGAVFKILITSSSNTDDVRQAFRDEDFFGLPEQAKDTSGFSSLRFERELTESFED